MIGHITHGPWALSPLPLISLFFDVSHAATSIPGHSDDGCQLTLLTILNGTHILSTNYTKWSAAPLINSCMCKTKYNTRVAEIFIYLGGVLANNKIKEKRVNEFV